jgi:signal transduction histidine kinase
MSIRSWIRDTVDLQPVSHRPPLNSRFWFYSATAFILPVVAQIAMPEDPGLTDELVWLVTLVPAFLLSLHYGIRGAFVALLMGTALFVVVQIIVALNFTPDDWRVTVPIYIAYGTLAISVGSLSEQLHGYYRRALENERMAAVGEIAVTIQHELNNALTIVVTESQLLESDADNLTEEQQESIKSIQNAGIRMAAQVEKLANLADAPVVTYSSGVQMIDLDAASVRLKKRPAEDEQTS